MIHLTDLECSMYVDHALNEADHLHSLNHLESCDLCQTRIGQFRLEKKFIGAALNIPDVVDTSKISAPKFTPTIGFIEFAMANLLTGCLVWLAQFLWQTVFGEVINNLISRLEIPVPNVYELLLNTMLLIAQEGTAMIDTYLVFVVFTLFVTSLGWLVYANRKSHSNLTMSLCWLTTIGMTLTQAPTAMALEHRQSEEIVTIAATETINDTLIILGGTVIVEGTVTGDLIVLGNRVVISGKVGGNLITLAKTVTLRGTVGGFSIAGADSVQLDGASVEGDLWSATSTLSISDDSRVGGNVTIGYESASIAGLVGQDLYAFGDSIELSGTVGKDFEVFSESVILLGNALVEGNLRFRTNDENKLHRSPAARISGDLEFLAPTAAQESSNRYRTRDFYVLQVVRLVSAFLAGVVMLWLLPVVRGVSLNGGIEGLKTAGIGLISLISLPVMAVLFGFTVVGLPLAVIGLMSWLLVIYFAKIVLALVVGHMLLRSTARQSSLPLSLFVGLVAILVVANLPAIGGVISFLLTIIGIGLIVQLLLKYAATLNSNLTPH